MTLADRRGLTITFHALKYGQPGEIRDLLDVIGQVLGGRAASTGTSATPASPTPPGRPPANRNDGYHPDHPVTCRQVTLMRLAVGAALQGDIALAALAGPGTRPPAREEYADLHALLTRVADQGGTFDLERVCGCCVDNTCRCEGTALRPASGSAPLNQAHRSQNQQARPIRPGLHRSCAPAPAGGRR